MKVIIAGSRSITGLDGMNALLMAIVKSGFVITEVVCGMARGVDMLGHQWAKEHSVPVKEMPADWDLGPAAGFIRNTKMAEYADALICVHVGSGGAGHMLRTAKKHGLKIYEVDLLKKSAQYDRA